MKSCATLKKQWVIIWTYLKGGGWFLALNENGSPFYKLMNEDPFYWERKQTSSAFLNLFNWQFDPNSCDKVFFAVSKHAHKQNNFRGVRHVLVAHSKQNRTENESLTFKIHNITAWICEAVEKEQKKSPPSAIRECLSSHEWVKLAYPCPRTRWRSTSSFQVKETFIQLGEEGRSRTWASIDMRHICHGNDVEPRQCTVIAEIFARDLISYILYFWLKIRNLVAYENHARIEVHETQPRLYENV